MAQQDITRRRYTDGKPNLRRFHQARWDEAIIFELSREGQRGILVPEVEAVALVTSSKPRERLWPHREGEYRLPVRPPAGDSLSSPGGHAILAGRQLVPDPRSPVRFRSRCRSSLLNPVRGRLQAPGEVKDEGSAVVIRPASGKNPLYVIMPMRV